MERATASDDLRPHTNANFLVDLGYGDSQSRDEGFCEVVFPEFRIDSGELAPPSGSEQSSGEHNGTTASRRLILRRGVTGSLDLYAWWDETRRGKAPRRRTVKVQLLAADHSTVVLTWHFLQVRPVSLSYAPLNALDGSVLIETIELDFDTMEMR